MLGDVSTAFLRAFLPEGSKVYVTPPVVDRKPGMVWKMKKALCGLRQSPQHFQEHMAKVLAAEGYLRLKADPQLYYHL
eukprot:9325152-Heterocapsa_arctica.AAC.1